MPAASSSMRACFQLMRCLREFFTTVMTSVPAPRFDGDAFETRPDACNFLIRRRSIHPRYAASACDSSLNKNGAVRDYVRCVDLTVLKLIALCIRHCGAGTSQKGLITLRKRAPRRGFRKRSENRCNQWVYSTVVVRFICPPLSKNFFSY